jgi:hypothetical protein
MHKVYRDGGNRVKFTRSPVDGHVTARTWDVDDQRWAGYTVIGPAEVRDLIRWLNREDD